MKTERRHELKTNELADWLGSSMDMNQPATRAVLATVLAAVVIAIAMYFWHSQSVRNNELAWDDVLSKMDEASSTNSPDMLASVAEQYRDSPAGTWARIRMGDLLLADGLQQLFSDRTQANAALTQAADAFKAARQSARDVQLLSHATYGLGLAYEGLNKLEDARKEYRQVYEKWPGSDFARIARQRETDLNRQQTKAFYDWFATTEPRRLPAEHPSIPGLNFDSSNLPGDDSSFLPPASFMPEASFPGTSAPLPAETSPPPAGSEPAAPADSTPETDSTPSADPPASTDNP